MQVGLTLALLADDGGIGAGGGLAQHLLGLVDAATRDPAGEEAVGTHTKRFLAAQKGIQTHSFMLRAFLGSKEDALVQRSTMSCERSKA